MFLYLHSMPNKENYMAATVTTHVILCFWYQAILLKLKKLLSSHWAALSTSSPRKRMVEHTVETAELWTHEPLKNITASVTSPTLLINLLGAESSSQLTWWMYVTRYQSTQRTIRRTIITLLGLFEFLCMLFRLYNVAQTLRRFIDDFCSNCISEMHTLTRSW